MSRRLVLAALLVATPAVAEPRPVTLDEAQAAAARAPAQEAAQRRTAAAVAEGAAAGGWRPTVVQLGGARSAHVVAVASVPLPILGAERTARRSARAEVEVARADEAAEAADRRLAVTVAWLELHRAGAVAQLAAESAARMAELARVTEQRRGAGDAALAEVVTAGAQAARARVDAESTAGAIEVAGAELAVWTGGDPSVAWVAAGPLPGVAPVSDGAAATAGTRGRNLDALPVLVALVRRAEAARVAIAEAEAAGRPVLGVELEVDALPPDDGATDVKALLSVELPLFGRGHARIEAARARAAARTAELAARRAELTAAQVAARTRWARAVRRARSFHDELVPAQTRSTELVRAAYQAGELELAAVLQAERDLLAVRAEAVEAEVATATAWAILEHAGGTP